MAVSPHPDAKRILAVSAEIPGEKGYGSLDADSQFDDIKREIDRSEHRDHLQWNSISATSVEGLINGLSKYKPNILHINSHGNRGELLLRGLEAKARPLTHEDLADIVQSLGGKDLEILFLDSCFSAIGFAQFDLGSVKAVIAMTDEIKNLYSKKFAVAFYYALGNGASVDYAVRQGKQIVKSANAEQEQIPELIVGRENVENYTPYLGVLSSGEKELLEEVRITPPGTMTEEAGYRYALLEVGPGYERVGADRIVNRKVPFEVEESDANGSELVARVHQTRAGLQFKCFVDVPGDPPFLEELEAMMAGAGWQDPSPDGRYHNRFWFLLDTERARPSAEGFVNNFLRWSPV